MENKDKKNKVGRPYTGGRNPANWHPENWKRNKPHVTTSITGSPEEIKELKGLAKQNDKTVSRFVLDSLLPKKEGLIGRDLSFLELDGETIIDQKNNVKSNNGEETNILKAI
jgi:hypothetical protein